MARLNAKLCLAATCLLFVCTAGASPAGDDVAEEDIEAQIAKLELEKQLLDKKIATARKGRAAPAQPSLTTEDGHVYITTGAVVRNVTDLLDSKTAMPLLKETERRSTKNVADLLDELTATGKATLEVGKATLEVGNATSAGIIALVGQVKDVVAQVKRVADAADAEKQSVGGGTPTKAAGAAFNPFTASVGALGGDRIRVTFPKGAELIADPSVKMYQCKFTYLKDKKLDPTKSKTSEAVAADTERTFSCVVPAWAAKGKMPDEPNFTTNFEVLENNRAMPAPSGGQVIKWTPQSPSLEFKNFLDGSGNVLAAGKLSGMDGTPLKFSVDISILYDYGEVGYKDIKLTAATDQGWAKIITQMSFSGTDTSAERKMGFTITHPKSGKEEQSYWIDVTITSSKYKLSTKHRLNFDFKKFVGLPIEVDMIGGYKTIFIQGCKKGEYKCQAQKVCDHITKSKCVHQSYKCSSGPSNHGSFYPPNVGAGSSRLNFGYSYDFTSGSRTGGYGNICFCTASLGRRYGLNNRHTNCGNGHWKRNPFSTTP